MLPFQRRRSVASLGSWVVALALAGGCGHQSTELEGETRHALLISIDTLRADHLGTYGYERDTSVNLDRWASRATVFENAFSVAPWTLTAHLSMLTGLFPIQHGVVAGDLALGANHIPLAESLQAEGVSTAGIYYPGWIHSRHGFARGFEIFEAHGGLPEAEELFSQVLMESDDSGRSFTFVHLFDVHSAPLDLPGPIYQAPPEYLGHFGPDAESILSGYGRRELWEREGGWEDHEVQAVEDLYDAAIRWVDEGVGRMIGQFGERWAEEEFLIVVTSDHGESLGQRSGQMAGHGGVFQEGLHVPLIVSATSHRAGRRRVKRPVSLVDIAPTVAGWLGVELSHEATGENLLTAAETAGGNAAVRVLEAYQHPHSVRVKWPRKVGRSNAGTALFLLDVDPDEGLPVLGGPADRAFDLMDQDLLEQLGNPTPSPAKIESRELEEMQALTGLGYAVPGFDSDSDQGGLQER